MSSSVSKGNSDSCPPVAAGPSDSDGGRALGNGALLACVGCVCLTILLGLLGPSAVEPLFGPAGHLPPWFWNARPPDLLIWGLVAVVLLLGTAAVIAGLAAIRRGWSPRPRQLLTVGTLAVAGLVCVPPMGTTDPLNYAAYGRMAALGLNPYRVTPFGLAQDGDPVGRLSIAEPWLHTPSVYGPLVTATEWTASLVGGTSMLRTVWILSLLSGAAFVATGALLLRLAGADPHRQARSQLLWTLNPVLLWNLVVGPHVDVLGAFCVVAAFWALRRSGLAVGLALAAATAVKLTLGIFALPFAWSMWHDRRRLVAAASAGVLALALGYGFVPRAIHNAAAVSSSNQSVVGSPWPLLQRRLLTPVFGSAAKHLVPVVEIMMVLGIAALLLAALPPVENGAIVQVTARPALALVGGYLLGTAYVRPWYDAVAWLLVAMLPRSWFDLVLIAHTTCMTLPFDPGLPYPLHPDWLNGVVRQTGYRAMPYLQALLFIAVVGICLWRIRHRHAGTTAAPPRPA
ncbi:hypothetical protein ABT173_48205 [Streptomyces sp. NPDC001795]|uniref:hypothetical protein n=1 Tax=Streptomyces sp. NPDC001795 TaxID=3154525 RepID=UPI00332A82F5